MSRPPVAVLRRHPRFGAAVLADARVACRFRGEVPLPSGSWRAACRIVALAWRSDAFLAQCCYRAKARMQALGIPVLPRLMHRVAMTSAQVCIGDPVVIEPGVYVAHGQVVIDGLVTVRSGAVIFPWVTIGLKAGNFQGPDIGRDVHIGTGAKVIGPVTVGAGSRIGANAVVISDVPLGATAVGVPARWS